MVYADELAPFNIAWSVDVDQRAPNAPDALSSPALLSKHNSTWLVVGGRDAWVHVYNLEGAEVRRFALQAPSDSGALALNNGLVVLGDTAGRLYAVDAEQGEIVWQKQLSASFTSAPIAVDGGFLVQTTDNRLYRFTQEGEKLWSFSGQGSVLSMYLNASPLVLDERVFVLLSNGDAVALKLSDGDLLWKRQLLLSNGSAVLSDLKVPLAQPVYLPRVQISGETSRETLLVPLFQGEMIGLSAVDGVQQFSLAISLKSSPAAVDSILFAADSQGVLHAYDIESGGRLWSKTISSGELLGPVVWQGSLWLADNKGKIFMVGLNGEVVSSMQMQGNISRLPMVTEAGLLVRTDRGMMTMLQL